MKSFCFSSISVHNQELFVCEEGLTHKSDALTLGPAQPLTVKNIRYPLHSIYFTLVAIILTIKLKTRIEVLLNESKYVLKCCCRQTSLTRKTTALHELKVMIGNPCVTHLIEKHTKFSATNPTSFIGSFYSWVNLSVDMFAL